MANFIGDVVYIADGIPATNDAAGFEALSWVKVEGVQTNPKFGLTHNIIEVPDLPTGLTIGEKGAAQGTETPMTFREVPGDAGRTLLKSLAQDPEGLTSVKVVTKASGPGNTVAAGDAVEYAQGVSHSFMPNDRTVTNYKGYTVQFRQNAAPVEATEPTP